MGPTNAVACNFHDLQRSLHDFNLPKEFSDLGTVGDYRDPLNDGG